MKLFNNHSARGLRGLPRFAEGIYWATGLSPTTPFTEGCPGANNKASPPGRHQEQASKQRCTFSSTTFSSVQIFKVQFRYHSINCNFVQFVQCNPANECGGRPLLHEHEVAVQTTTQPGNCSPPPGTYRSGAIEHPPHRFQVYLRLSWTSTLLAVGTSDWHYSNDHGCFSKGLPALPMHFTGRLVYIFLEDPLHGGVRRS